MDLVAPKIILLGKYLISYSELAYVSSVKGECSTCKKNGFASIRGDKVIFKLHRTLFSSWIQLIQINSASPPLHPIY